jgi:hypothetical protein
MGKTRFLLLLGFLTFLSAARAQDVVLIVNHGRADLGNQRR